MSDSEVFDPTQDGLEEAPVYRAYPEGKYLVKLTQYEPKVSKAGNNMHEVSLRVEEPLDDQDMQDTENNFPLKELSIGDNFNNKDQIALAHADQELIHKWKERNSSLVDEIGEEHFNAGNPALGTVGVFSKFYCITEKSIKTVDELFSNGFKL